MKIFKSKSVKLTPTGMTVDTILASIDKLLVDHGVELVAVHGSNEITVLTNSIVSESIVMETPPTNFINRNGAQDTARCDMKLSKDRLPA